MKTQTHVEPETRHILPFLAWTFGISWSAWRLFTRSVSPSFTVFFSTEPSIPLAKAPL